MTKKNLNSIEKDSNCFDVLSLNPRFVASQVKYAPVPENEIWRINFIEELLKLRSNELSLDGFTKNEIEDMILFIATS